MDIDTVLFELHHILNISSESCTKKIKKYESMLHKEIKNNPRNIRAVCLLAILKCELRKSVSTSIRYLKSAYDNFKDSICDVDFCMLATNLAYFYIEECLNKEKEAKKLLQAAINRNSPFAQTYYAMALEYYKEDQFEHALPLFQKAMEISTLFQYRYSYAICLSKCNQLEKSIEILKVLSLDYETHEYKAKAYYTLGVLYACSGEKSKVKKIAFDLLDIDYCDLELDHSDLAELMFLVDEFQQCINLYDKIKLYETADWLSLYFYSLKQIRCTEEATKKPHDVIVNLKKEMNSYTVDDFEGNKKEYEEFISREKERIESIINAYNDVFYANNTPVAKPQINMIYVCYYIDCPRHRFDDIQSTTA